MSSLLAILLLSSLPLAFATCRENDILLELKSELGNPKTLPFDQWDSATHCCFLWSGVRCDLYGTVIQLYISGGSYYSGPLPPAIGKLTGLVRLQLFGFRNVNGTLPEFLTNLRCLEDLTIEGTRLSGRLPPFLSTSFPNLHTLDLSNNEFVGSIPHCFGPNFTDIRLHNNQLTGRIPSCLGAKYANIDLSGSRLSGRIPDTFTGQILDLGNKHLVGEIPRSFAAINFTLLSLYGNQLTGDASFLFGATKTLVWINLSHNRLNFDLSNVEYPTGIHSIWLKNNNLTGGISEFINNIRFLSDLNLSYNELCGPIPEGMNTAKFLDAFDHNKCLCGTPLPPCA